MAEDGKKWSELGTPVEPLDTDTVAMQRGLTNPRWSFATLRAYLDPFISALYAPLSRLISSGDGLQGGGDLSADRSLSVDSTVARLPLPTGTGSPLTTKGDLYAFGPSDTRLPVGTSGDILVPDAAEPTGLKWVPDPAGAGDGTYKEVQKAGSQVSADRARLNFIEGANVTLTIADQLGNDATDITVAATDTTGIEPVSPFLTRYFGIIQDGTTDAEKITSQMGGAGSQVYCLNSPRFQYDIWFNNDVTDDSSSQALIGLAQEGAKLGGTFAWWQDLSQQFDRENGSFSCFGSQLEIEGTTIQAAAALPTTSAIGAEVMVDDTGQLFTSPISATWGPETDTSASLFTLPGDTGTGPASVWVEFTDLALTLVNSGDAMAQVSVYAYNNTIINSGRVEFVLDTPGQGSSGPTGGSGTILNVNQAFDRMLTFRIALGAVTGGQQFSLYARRYFRSDPLNGYEINFNGAFGEHSLSIFEPAGGGGGGGEANTSTTPATVGANEADVNMAKQGADLQKRKLVGGTNVTLTQGADAITFDVPTFGDMVAPGTMGTGNLYQSTADQTVTADSGIAASSLLRDDSSSTIDSDVGFAWTPNDITGPTVTPAALTTGQCIIASNSAPTINAPTDDAAYMIAVNIDVSTPSLSGFDEVVNTQPTSGWAYLYAQKINATDLGVWINGT